MKRAYLIASVLVGFLAPVLSVSHQEKAAHSAIVCCVDMRYGEDVALWQKVPKGYHWCWPGCAKEFIENEKQRELFITQLSGFRERGKTLDTIILADHTTCAWYGKEDSPENHTACLRKAAQILQKDPRTAKFTVELYIHDFKTNQLEPVSLK